MITTENKSLNLLTTSLKNRKHLGKSMKHLRVHFLLVFTMVPLLVKN